MDLAYQAPLSVGFFRLEYWSGFPCPPLREPSQPRDQTHISCILANGFFTTESPGKPPCCLHSLCISSVQSLSRVRLSATPWTATRQASLSITNSWSLLNLMSIELVMPSNHLILFRPLLLLPSIFPSIRVFSNESVLSIRWPKFIDSSVYVNPKLLIYLPLPLL